jgi:hypothetical protein
MMKIKDAEKIRQMLDAYETLRGHDDENAQKYLQSLLGFLDGYTSGILSQD